MYHFYKIYMHQYKTDNHPVDQMDGLAYIIIFGVIILISLVIVLWDPHGLIGDYLYIIPITLKFNSYFIYNRKKIFLQK